MKREVDRREFVKSLATASIAPILLRRAAAGSLHSGSQASAERSRMHLEPFDYNGVRLLDGMLKKQYEATRDYYFNLPNDDLLLGFRKRAGLAAPGVALGGWYSMDMGNALGQWLSGMARMYKATGDQPILDKASYL